MVVITTVGNCNRTELNVTWLKTLKIKILMPLGNFTLDNVSLATHSIDCIMLYCIIVIIRQRELV